MMYMHNNFTQHIVHIFDYSYDNTHIYILVAMIDNIIIVYSQKKKTCIKLYNHMMY